MIAVAAARSLPTRGGFFGGGIGIHIGIGIRIRVRIATSCVGIHIGIPVARIQICIRSIQIYIVIQNWLDA